MAEKTLQFNLKNFFKNILIVVFCALMLFCFSACYLPDLPETVMINNTVYRSGFYGNLYPDTSKSVTLEAYNIKFHKFYRVESDKYDLVCSTNNSFEVVYFIAESQWQGARDYYTNSDNLSFYLQVGNKFESDSIIVKDIDFKKFNELLIFADENGYDPFDSKKNESIKTRRLPMPDANESPEFRFYCNSNDGIFTSMLSDYFIIDGKLLMLFHYDLHYGEYDEAVVCDVPEELGNYFIELYLQMIK